MANTFVISRNHLVLGVCLPLAVMIGYILADPLQSTSLAVLVFVLSILSVPILLKWHHPLLIFSCQAPIVFMLLPGPPPLWMIMAGIGFIFAVIDRCVDRQRRIWVGGAVGWSLVFLGGVVLLTALVTGGVGVRAFGSTTFGGKRYFTIAFAIMMYFVLASRRVPLAQARFYTGLFFLSGTLAVLSFAGPLSGGKLIFINYFIPIESVMGDPMAAPERFDIGLVRVGSLVTISLAICLYLLAAYGVRGILNPRKLWRLLLLLVCFAAGLYGGFRWYFGYLCLLFAFGFFLEGLHRTRYLVGICFLGVTAAVFLTAFSTRLPLSIQRAVSFLPIEINPAAKQDAQASLDWRLGMWRNLLPEVPQYLFKGKGYVLDPRQLALAYENSYRGLGDSADTFALTGDYHNGPLSVVIPFGIWGVLGFGWFLVAGIRLLHRNCAHGDPALLTINRALFVCFVARGFFFIFIGGDLSTELAYFASFVGFGVGLNGNTQTAAQQPDEAQLMPALPVLRTGGAV